MKGRARRRRPQNACSGPSRRDFLKVGAIGGLGLTLGDYFMMQDAGASNILSENPKAKSAIFIFMAGGSIRLFFRVQIGCHVILTVVLR